MVITLEPIATVRNARPELGDDGWGEVESRIELSEGMPTEALDGVDAFSHVEVIFHFDQVPEAKIVRGARHPRNNAAWPRVGILGQRGKSRPNRLGLTTARVGGREGRALRVVGLDAVDGTPVLDIKPVMREFLPRGEVRQPEWAGELMARYW